MLSVNSYDKEYVDACRAKVDRQVATYKELAAAAKDPVALAAFEPLFFNHMLLVLDHYFMHRARGIEKKDGNPLNEVRVLCNSLMENDGVMVADTQIKLRPDSSLLGYEVGDEIALSEADFVPLAAAFFEEIESKYP